MKIAVAGGTGLTGQRLVASLNAAGHETVVLSRRSGVDLVEGSGLDPALDGVEVVVDLSNLMTTSAKKSIGFFEPATRNLLAAEERAGVRHHVVLGIVGSDLVDYGYYFGKRRQEELVRAGAVPWTIVRATQFHEFAEQVLERIPGPIALVPTMVSQPIAVAEVADHLAGIATGEPLGLAPELAGPRQEHLPDQIRRLLRAQGKRRPVVPVRVPGKGARHMAQGALLPKSGGPRGVQTYEDWLAEKFR